MEAARLPGLLGLTLLLACAPADPLVAVVVDAELEAGPPVETLALTVSAMTLTDADERLHHLPFRATLDVIDSAAEPTELGRGRVPAGIYEWVFFEADDVDSDGVEVHNVVERTGLPPLDLQGGDAARILVTLILLRDVGQDSGSLYVKGATVRRTRRE